MNELVKRDQEDLSPALSPKERSMIIASKATKVLEMTELSLGNLVTDAIDQAILDLGHKNVFQTNDEKTLLVKSITTDIIEHFKTLSGEEIKKAIRLGVRGEFKVKADEVINITAVNIYKWLKAYKDVLKREIAKKQYEYQKEKDIKDAEYISQKIKESEQLNFADLRQKYEDFKNGKGVMYQIIFLYDFINSKNLIKLSNQRKREIFMEEIGNYIKKITKDNGAVTGKDREERRNNRDFLLRVQNANGDIKKLNNDSEVKNKIDSICKYQAIKITFEDILKSGLSLDEYMNLNDNK